MTFDIAITVDEGASLEATGKGNVGIKVAGLSGGGYSFTRYEDEFIKQDPIQCIAQVTAAKDLSLSSARYITVGETRACMT